MAPRRRASALLVWLVAALVALPVAEHTAGAASARSRVTPHAATSKKKKKRRTRPRPVPAPIGSREPVIAAKPTPIPTLPPSTGKQVTPEDIAEQRVELEEMREEAKRSRAAAARIRGREQSVGRELQRVEQDLRTTTRYLKQLNAREAIVSGQRRLTEANLRDAILRRESQRQTLAWRLREIYKFGRDRRFETLVSSRSFAELVERSDFFARILEADRALLGAINAETARIDAHRGTLVATGQQLAMIAGEKRSESGRLASLKSRRVATITELKRQRGGYEQNAREQEAAAKRIQRLIAILEARRREQESGKQAPDTWLLSADFAKNRGHLPWPVRGNVVGTFGRSVNPRFNTVTLNNGIDIAAPRGTDIQAVARGRVEVTEVLPGYGRSIILNHGSGYYTIYGHCSAVLVAQGAQVEGRQVIARVGESGSLKGPILHFEIRKGRQAVDPVAWLQ